MAEHSFRHLYLVEPMKKVEAAYNECKVDPAFQEELLALRKSFIGRPSPIYHCKNISEKLGGAYVLLSPHR